VAEFAACLEEEGLLIDVKKGEPFYGPPGAHSMTVSGNLYKYGHDVKLAEDDPFNLGNQFKYGAGPPSKPYSDPHLDLHPGLYDEEEETKFTVPSRFKYGHDQKIVKHRVPDKFKYRKKMPWDEEK